MINMDDDALIAGVDLVGRSGARSIEIGYLHDDVPAEEADWWASANYRGTKLQVEHAPSPVAAVEALALRVLAGGMCNHCKKLVALQDDGAFAWMEAHLLNGVRWNVEDAARAGQCRWRREGRRWVRGCE